MDYASYCSNAQTPEDSGLGESSRYESNSTSASYTPTTSLLTSRKRKLERVIYKCHSIKYTSNVDSVESSPWIKNPAILSSTLNDSITTAVENCKLGNYSSLNDTRADTSFLRNVTEPTTPKKCSKSNHGYHNSASSTRLSPLLKLGSPERNEIIYPNLPNLSSLSESKRCSPAKKRLFVPQRKDPVLLFCKEKNVSHVVKKIFLFLKEKDLYSCSKVSKTWKRQIMQDKQLKLKLQAFVNYQIINKENNFESPVPITGIMSSFCHSIKQSTPVQPMSKIYEIRNSLTEDQHLERCWCCNKPEAIVEKNISQCTNLHCGAIRCLKCNSISTRGPENFVDKCQQSQLLMDKPPSRHSLLNSPMRCQNVDGLSPFFLDDSANVSQTLNSSGYLTDQELSQNSRRYSGSFAKDNRLNISHVLKPYNMNIENQQYKSWDRRNSVCPVITLKKREEIIEPSSPPKVKHVAGTMKSKKMLKRLNI